MHHSGAGQCRISWTQQFRLIPNAHLARPGNHEVKLVLALMNMRRMLLTGFERVKPGEEEISGRNRALPHPAGIESGKA